MEAAIKNSGRSMRDVSLSAGVSAGYVFGILRKGREPGLERMAAITSALGVSLEGVLFGIDMTGEDEQLLRVYATLSDEQKKALRTLARLMAPGRVEEPKDDSLHARAKRLLPASQFEAFRADVEALLRARLERLEVDVKGPL